MSELSRPTFGMFQLDKDKKPITRERVCVCGKQFTQSILSERFLESAERMGTVDAIAQQIPGFWVPKYCPPCERKDLSLEARRAEFYPNRGAA